MGSFNFIFSTISELSAMDAQSISIPLQPEKHSHLDFTRVYDPCFMLPLFSHLLAPESRISVRKVTRSGALSYILMALSSSRSNVRTAAFHCLLRFSSHLAR